MTYTIHSDKRGFYFKVWAADNSYPPKYITAARYVTEELAELMAQDYIELGPYV